MKSLQSTVYRFRRCTLHPFNFTLFPEAIRLDEEPVLKTGGCRNVACEFESHGFRLGTVYRFRCCTLYPVNFFAFESDAFCFFEISGPAESMELLTIV